MQSIQNMILEANAIRAASSDNDVQVLAGLVQELAIRLQDVEAIAETNENALVTQSQNGLGLPFSYGSATHPRLRQAAFI